MVIVSARVSSKDLGEVDFVNSAVFHRSTSTETVTSYLNATGTLVGIELRVIELLIQVCINILLLCRTPFQSEVLINPEWRATNKQVVKGRRELGKISEELLYTTINVDTS